MESRTRYVMEVVAREVREHPDFAEGFASARRGDLHVDPGQQSDAFRAGWTACYDALGVAAWVRALGFGHSLEEIADGIERGDWIPGFSGTSGCGAEVN